MDHLLNLVRRRWLRLIIFGSILVLGFWRFVGLNRDNYQVRPFNHVHATITPSMAAAGLTPEQIRSAYHILSAAAGSGTIAIIDAYDDPSIEADLAVFDRQFKLKSCTIVGGCLEKHQMTSTLASSTGWSGETALDVEWAHAIAPGAKILLVEAASASRTNLLKAVDYARSRSDVVAVSMSWGGDEFSTEAALDSHFTSSTASFFASAGDDGHGTSWPAVSAKVIAVGGTRLNIGSSVTETAWSGSGGGVSTYVRQPDFQKVVGSTSPFRTIPDVAFNADPNSGFPIYNSQGSSSTGWYLVGGTSAGAPQWAGLKAIDHGLTLGRLYQDSSRHFRDIKSGQNGSCSTCRATSGYDLVTGLGSPLGSSF